MIKKVIRKEKECYATIKVSIYQDVTILNVHEPNSKASKYMRQKLRVQKKELL